MLRRSRNEHQARQTTTEGNRSSDDGSQTLWSARPYTNWLTSSQRISDAGTHSSFLRLWNKWTQAGWLKHTEMYSLLILEPEVWSQDFSKPYSQLEALGKNPPCLFQLPMRPHSMASMACWSPYCYLGVFLHIAFSSSVCIFSSSTSHKHTCRWIEGPT